MADRDDRPAARVAIGVEYDGTAFQGWQRQSHGRAIQNAFEAALSAVADQPVEAVCAGRTDAGVHATGQVIHFDPPVQRRLRSWLLGTNSNLPADVSVSWARAVSADFHARYSAVSRSYRYLILNRPVRSALHRHRACWVHQPLDEGRMDEAARHLIGEHDFSAFRAAGCQSRSPVRNVTAITVCRQGEWVAIDVSANAFLQHMIRNIAGLLITVGRGEREPGWAAELLAGRDRTAGPFAAAAAGLTLVAVDYPPEFGLPDGRDFAGLPAGLPPV
ncbi:tRNA pseudouridine(38-40) synthase TruA [Lentisalinibacter sediminis]|uniref:tRNA pseudouridine(38-40) synthase TruA n=1 Tax=Lentisalinibacter sediminis TaxID=2992237 RepID=UPI00386B2CF7